MEYVSSDPTDVGNWIKEHTEPVGNIVLDDGIMERAPTKVKELHTQFKKWCMINGMESREILTRKKFTEEVLYWQESSVYGLRLGTPNEPNVNGHKGCPLINLVHLDHNARRLKDKATIDELREGLAKANKIADLYKQLYETLE